MEIDEAPEPRVLQTLWVADEDVRSCRDCKVRASIPLPVRVGVKRVGSSVGANAGVRVPWFPLSVSVPVPVPVPVPMSVRVPVPMSVHASM